MRITIPKVHGETPREKLIRSLALVLVFAAVIWAFMKNNERVVQILNQESAVYDETGTLDKDQKQFIVSFTKTIKEEWGVTARVQIFGGDFTVPELDGKTLYIGLSPSIGVAELRFPPIMAAALGPDFPDYLKTTFLYPSFQEGDWPMATQEVLSEIFNKLNALNKDTKSE